MVMLTHVVCRCVMPGCNIMWHIYGSSLTAKRTSIGFTLLSSPLSKGLPHLNLCWRSVLSAQEGAQGPSMMDMDDMMPSERRIPLVDGGYRIKIRKDLYNEVMLVCSNILTVNNDGDEQELIRNVDTPSWAADLQRAIHRDSDHSMPVRRQLGAWQVFQQKLLPLLRMYHDDTELSLMVLKLMVMLTMGVDEDTRRDQEAANNVRQLERERKEAGEKRVKSTKTTKDWSKKELTALEQREQQREFQRQYKAAFLKTAIEGDATTGEGRLTYTGILVQLISEAISHTGSDRTEADNIWIELFLSLIRNLLQVPNPTPGSQSTLDGADRYSMLQEELLLTLKEEHVLDIVWFLMENVDDKENRGWTLELAEIADLIFKGHDPTILAKISVQGKLAAAEKPGTDLLKALKTERQLRAISTESFKASSRHGRWGGTVKLNSNCSVARVTHNIFDTGQTKMNQVAKRKNKFTQRMAERADMQVFASETPLHARVRTVLAEEMDQFLRAYIPLMRAVKTMHHRQASELVPDDKHVFFRVVAFSTAFYRAQQEQRKRKVDKETKEAAKAAKAAAAAAAAAGEPAPVAPVVEPFVFHIGPILETLDMFTFRFIMSEVDHSIDTSNWRVLESALPTLKELMAALAEMRKSTRDDNRKVATALMNKLFYEKDSLDVLPKLMRQWKGGVTTRAFMAHLAEAAHVVLKMLETNAQNMIVLGDRRRRKVQQDSDSDSDDDEEERRKKKAAAKELYEVSRREEEFDFGKYFERMLTNDVVRLYGVLLEGYATNTVATNHHIHTFFHRVSTFEVAAADPDAGLPAVTAEPMLFKVQLLDIFNKMLQDPRTNLKLSPQFAPLRNFANVVVRHLARLAKVNTLLYHEALHWAPWPLRMCVSIGRVYAEDGPRRAKKVAVDNSSDEEEAQAASGEDSDFGDEFNGDGGEEGVSPKSAGAEGEEQDDAAPGDKEARKAARKVAKKAAREAAKKAATWTGTEDNFLRREFPKMAEMPSVFDVLAAKPLLRERQRTAKTIEKRVQYLRLQGRQASAKKQKERKQARQRAQELASMVLQTKGGAAGLLWLASRLEDCRNARAAQVPAGAVLGPLDADWCLVPIEPAHFVLLKMEWAQELLHTMGFKAPREGNGQWMWRIAKEQPLEELRVLAKMLRTTEEQGSKMPGPKLGQRVEIRWSEDGEYYSARVTGYNADTRVSLFADRLPNDPPSSSPLSLRQQHAYFCSLSHPFTHRCRNSCTRCSTTKAPPKTSI